MSNKTEQEKLEEWKEYVQFSDVDYLEVELFQLPVQTTTLDYMISFKKPVATILQREPIRVSAFASATEPEVDWTKHAVLNRWRDMISEAFQVPDLPEEHREMYTKLMSIDKVKIHHMELVRKDEV